MQGSDPNRVTPRSEATGSWRPRPDAPGRAADPENAPTVRRSGSGSGRERVAPLPAALPRAGEVLGEYELIDTIGVGGMGAVFRGIDHGLERFAAIKVLPRLPDEEAEPEDVQRFHQEARAAARLDHDGIARVFGLGRDHGFHFIAFEFIEGTNLRHLVEDRGPLTAHDTILYSLQVAAALVHATERGVVHRDVKPSNIIVTPQGRAKLVDMGLARRFERERDEAGLTQSGTTLGSFDYISPEQARDPRDVDVRSDLYSLGCTMFHVLTGKPPFADGTVLQKLIQHQEEPPPNVRDANPAVPSGLAAIVSKLMAKDRNRRYQSPEQLGHDLLTLAADLGLRLPSFDFSGRAPAVDSRRWWRKPALWAAAAAALMAVPLIASLSWIVRDRVAIASLEQELLAASLAPRMAAPVDEPIGNEQDPELEPPKFYRITNDIELATALAQASSNSTLELVGDGPFEIRRTQPVINRDLMLKADPSARPVLRLGRGSSRRNGEPLPPMLHFTGGHLILEGLQFDLETGAREDTATALVAEDVDLEIRRCTFRRGPGWWNPGRGVALDLRSKLTAQLSPPVQIQASSFEGPLTAIVGRGALDLRISDCLFGLNSSVVRLERSGFERGLPAKIDLRRISVLAGDGPVFRLAGTPPRIKVDNSVFAPSPTDDRPVNLISADEPDRLNWSGRENLYARIGSFLQAASEDTAFTPIRRINTWSEDPPREFGSMLAEGPVWADSQPAARLVDHEPERAFRLAPMEQGSPMVGARQGPNEEVPAPTSVVGRKPTTAPKPNENPDTEPRATTIAAAGPPAPAEMPAPIEVARTEVEPPRPEAGVGDEPVEPGQPRPTPMVRPGVEPAAEEPGPIQNQQEFLDEVHRLGPRGGTLVLAANSVLRLPPQDFRSAGQWTIRAETKPGENRPLILFVPTPTEVKPRPQHSWHALFRLREKASLHLEGVDVVLPEIVLTSQQIDRPWTAFGVAPGTELELVNCTVTVEGRTSPMSAAIAVRSWDEVADREADATARVRVDDSLIRGSGDLINVGASRRLTLNLRNTAVATGGVLLRGSGADRTRNAEPAPLKLALHKVSCWTTSGLVALKANPGETELPTVEVAARESIVALTNNSNSLIRIEGQEDPETAVDPIRWDGHGVAYQGIEIYRQEAYPGELPNKQYRPAWQDSQKLRDTAPIFNELQFTDPPRPNQNPWTITRDQFRLDDESRARKVGADPDAIPPTPSSS